MFGLAPIAALPLALAIDLAPLWSRSRRTLIDSLTGSEVARLSNEAPALRDGWARVIDVALPIFIGVPLLVLLGINEVPGAALAQAFGLGLVLALQLYLFRQRRTSVGRLVATQ